MLKDKKKSFCCLRSMKKGQNRTTVTIQTWPSLNCFVTDRPVYLKLCNILISTEATKKKHHKFNHLRDRCVQRKTTEDTVCYFEHKDHENKTV